MRVVKSSGSAVLDKAAVAVLVGGFLANALGMGDGGSMAGLIGSVIGAVILLALYRMFVGRRSRV